MIMNNINNKVSIIIPSYNSQESIMSCLESLREPMELFEYEIIVVDCSGHNQVERICSQFSFVNFIKRKKRFNPGEGRNIGAQNADGKLLMFIDADVILEKNVISNAWNHYKKGYNVFGGSLELSNLSPKTIASRLEHSFYNHESQKNRPARKRNNLSSAFLFIEKSLFDELGGFKDIPRMQDTEFTERIRKTGIDLWFFPDIVAHQIQDSPLSKVFRKIYINGLNLPSIRYQNRSIWKTIFLFCFLPLITLAKCTRIILRNIKYGTYKIKELAISPLILIGGIVWMFGFYHSIILNREVSKHR